ncbi:MAG: GNAT family N-acetyltransferase, partial [Terriglobales bacterium]
MRDEIAIRQLESVPEFEACVQMQTQVWGFADRDLVPRRMFVVANKIGGHVLGGWDGDRLAGFCLALPGRRDDLAYWHSHMTAVAEPYRNLGLGKRLKFAQREAALQRG